MARNFVNFATELFYGDLGASEAGRVPASAKTHSNRTLDRLATSPAPGMRCDDFPNDRVETMSACSEAQGRKMRKCSFVILLIAFFLGPVAAVRADCDRDAFRRILDDAAAIAPNGGPSSAVGYSAALESPRCLFFAAVGQSKIESGRALTSFNQIMVGSLTKLFVSYLTLQLVEQGQLDMNDTVDEFFSASELQQLTAGCTVDCPDFSTATIRKLLNATHDLQDWAAVDRNNNRFVDIIDLGFERLLKSLGIPTIDAPESDSPFDLLVAIGIRRDRNFRGFELPNFGNTGYQLLGLILERVTGQSLGHLVRRKSAELPIVFPFQTVKTAGLLGADGYTVTTGAGELGLPEDLFGIYPTVSTPNGHTAINVRNLDNSIALSGNGGAGTMMATPIDYLTFFRALVKGQLLGQLGQRLFDDAFVPVPDDIARALFGGTNISHGFGLFRQNIPELGLTVLFKEGATFSSQCHVLHLVESDATVVVCRNSRDLFKGLLVTGPPTAANTLDVARALLNRLVAE